VSETGAEIALRAPGSAAARIARPVRTAAVGMSIGPTCGVRDHALVLAEALDRENVSCSLHWLGRSEESIGAARSEIRAWTQELAAELDGSRPDAVLLHYSVFSYSYRGFPLFVHPTLAALHSSRIPLITVLHEFVFAAKLGGLRGKAWAATQRALLIAVMRASAAVVVTTDFRAEWLVSRPWLSRRPVVFAPVFSNLPPAAIRPRSDRGYQVIGLFGYSYRQATVSIVLDALRRLEDRGLRVQLKLLGAPGPESELAEVWRVAARTRAIAQALSFSGVLSAQDLSDALAGCDVLLCVDPPGPTSRKTTLAASLASGTAVIALDGPRRWSELIESEAARVVQPTSLALADELDALLADQSLREALGARGRAFAERSMSVGRSAGAVAGLLDDILSAGRP